MVIATATKTKIVRKIIKPKIKGGISISPKETKNKRGKEFISPQKISNKCNNKTMWCKNLSFIKLTKLRPQRLDDNKQI